MNRINAAQRFAPGIIEGPVMKTPMKFATLPLAATLIGLTVLQQNPKRIGAILKNVGTGNVYLSTKQNLDSTKEVWPLAPGESLSFPGSDNPTAPLNAVYATADAGHDLRVMEIVASPLTGNEYQV